MHICHWATWSRVSNCSLHYRDFNYLIWFQRYQQLKTHSKKCKRWGGALDIFYGHEETWPLSCLILLWFHSLEKVLSLFKQAISSPVWAQISQVSEGYLHQELAPPTLFAGLLAILLRPMTTVRTTIDLHYFVPMRLAGLLAINP